MNNLNQKRTKTTNRTMQVAAVVLVAITLVLVFLSRMQVIDLRIVVPFEDSRTYVMNMDTNVVQGQEIPFEDRL